MDRAGHGAWMAAASRFWIIMYVCLQNLAFAAHVVDHHPYKALCIGNLPACDYLVIVTDMTDRLNNNLPSQAGRVLCADFNILCCFPSFVVVLMVGSRQMHCQTHHVVHAG